MFLQIVSDTTAAAAPITEEKLNLLELTMKGGLIMIPIAVLFVIGIYLTIERYMTIKKAAKQDAGFMANVKDMVANGNIAGAKSLCANNGTPIGRMLEKGISRIGKPMKNIEVAIENVGKLEIYRLEKGMATLATISGAAPMIGFLGTVTGMIRAFFRMANAGNNIDITQLSGGIYEAMVTTVAGLIVGIFAYIGHNLLSAMIEKVVHRMEAAAVEFIDLLQEPA
ncbi:MAG: MotA/TolQ/ExbB proton channel family protein [Bacteroidota bacterium]|nr:MotA/TolQ/ExbB proton channel family protein [Bacteroidota bacterium]MDX5431785.1 MotA/TolQ/ExbB proton channel family protein [Bacteroidota bacterium]MDX5470498.1 MotA/TolQ/ExbB proton channel family protein [Bacteroidota bacterium]